MSSLAPIGNSSGFTSKSKDKSMSRSSSFPEIDELCDRLQSCKRMETDKQCEACIALSTLFNLFEDQFLKAPIINLPPGRKHMIPIDVDTMEKKFIPGYKKHSQKHG